MKRNVCPIDKKTNVKDIKEKEKNTDETLLCLRIAFRRKATPRKLPE